MKIKSHQMIALGVGAVALYFLLKPRSASAATYTVKPASGGSSAIQIGPVAIPSAPVANLISTGVSSGVNALTSWLGGSSAPTPTVPSTPLDQATIDQINSGFLGFGRTGGGYGRFGLLLSVSR